MPKKHTISCSADVKMHAVKSVVSPVNLLYKGSVGKGSRIIVSFARIYAIRYRHAIPKFIM